MGALLLPGPLLSDSFFLSYTYFLSVMGLYLTENTDTDIKIEMTHPEPPLPHIYIYI